MRTLLITSAIAAATFCAPGAVRAETYIVDSASDLSDVSVADGVCNANPTGIGPTVCTLRAAIQQANSDEALDIIVVPGALTVGLTSDLPALTNDVEINGEPGPALGWAIVDGQGSHRAFEVNAANVVLRRLRLINNQSPAALGGGALRINPGSTVVVDEALFQDNASSSYGGAIYNFNGALQIARTHFQANVSSETGGAIHTSGAEATTELRASSIRASEAYTGAETPAAVVGRDDSLTTVINTLIDGTSTPAAASATAGIWVSGASLVMNNSTLYENGTGVIFGSGLGRVLEIRNTAMVQNDGADCQISGQGASITFDGNLVEDGSCANFEPLSGNVDLLDVQDAPSAFVQFRRPIWPSLLIDAIDPESGGCEVDDQRGQPRPQDGDADGIEACDIGAVEAVTLVSDLYVVDTEEDLIDTDTTDKVCNAAGFGAEPRCSLRAAIMQANAKLGPDRIRFVQGLSAFALDIAGAGLTAGDLDITEAVDIRGNLVDGLPEVHLLQQTADRHFHVQVPAGHTVEIRNLEMVSGSAANGAGGAILVESPGAFVHLSRLDLNGNDASTGGALALVSGAATISESDFWNNTVGDGSGEYMGAALYVSGNATASIAGTSFWGNEDTGVTDTQRETIHVDMGGSLSLDNSTVGPNESGGIRVIGGAVTSIRTSTVAHNQGYGLRTEFFGDEIFYLQGSILSDNSLADCRADAADDAATYIARYNLVEDVGAGCFFDTTNLLNVNPMLQLDQVPVRPYGSISRVMPPSLAQDNPAIDVTEPLTAWCPPTDQLGNPRGIDIPEQPDDAGSCDLGAVEVRLWVFGDGFEDEGTTVVGEPDS